MKCWYCGSEKIREWNDGEHERHECEECHATETDVPRPRLTFMGYHGIYNPMVKATSKRQTKFD